MPTKAPVSGKFSAPTGAFRPACKHHGLVVGIITEVTAEGETSVIVPLDPTARPKLARSIIRVNQSMIGTEVAIMFDSGSVEAPVIIGQIQKPNPGEDLDQLTDVEVDGKHVIIEGHRQIVLRCGKASITLNHDGGIQIRGSQLLSRSSGVNRIKGAAVQIN